MLHDEKMAFSPREFYIADVTDKRAERTSVASLITINQAHLPVTQPVNLQGGAAAAIKQFIDRNLHRDTKLRPVIITIKAFKLTESASPGGRINGHLAVTFSFELQQGDRTAHLTDYTGGIRYDRPDKQVVAAEPVLRQGIQEALLYFDQWMDQQADNNILLAKAVKVKFTDYTEKPEGDTIYYATDRPLTWADFRERPMPNGFEAEVFASIGYNEQTEVSKGIVNVSIALKVDIPKSDCWVRGSGRDAYTLNHEQRHFDIEKLVGEHFKRTILALHLPVDNYDGPINVEYLETLREATRLQKQYDTETRHGMNHQAQARWNEKIDKELRDLGIKK